MSVKRSKPVPLWTAKLECGCKVEGHDFTKKKSTPFIPEKPDVIPMRKK